MTEAVIRQFVAPYYDSNPNALNLKRRRSLEEARKDFAFVQLFDFGLNRILRKPAIPCGLRNIGNTCYFNMFIQLLYSINCLRDTFLQVQPQFVRDPLSTEMQTLFAKIYLTKFAYCDPTGVFAALNRSNVDSIQLGDQYDFYEYFSITLDTLEKCLAKQPAFSGKDKLLQLVFYGSMTQQLLNGKDNNPKAVKFGIVNLDVKYLTLEKAFEAFKNYNIEGYRTSSGISVSAEVKSQITVFPGIMVFSVNRVGMINGGLEKDNTAFSFPNHIAFDRTNNTIISQLTKEELDTEAQIDSIQKTLKSQKHQMYLESLRKTFQFLELQSKPQLDKGSVSPTVGVESDINALAQTKTQIKTYISKLEENEIMLRKKLQELQQQKNRKATSTDIRKYSLHAVMIHEGSASSGHYYTFIYNQNTRLWHRYSDREVTPASSEEVLQTAMGLIRPESNVSCLVYKSSDIKCDPTSEPPINQNVRNRVLSDDEFISENIDRIRLERLLRNSAQIARQETEMRVEGYRNDPMVFQVYFDDHAYYYISSNEPQKAELYRLRRLIYDPTFKNEVSNSRLSQGNVIIPTIEMEADGDYVLIMKTVKMALNEQCRNNIYASLLYLGTRHQLKFKKVVIRQMLQNVIFLFLLKSCFYIDLMMQKNQKIGELLELIKFLNKSLPVCLLTRQINENLKHSLQSAGQKYNQKVVPIKLTEAVFEKARPADNIEIERVFSTRFALWSKFFRNICISKATIKQEYRVQQEMVQLVQYAES